MNDAAAAKLASMSDGSIELLDYIATIEKQYPAEDFDEETYSALVSAIDAAKKLVNDGTYTATQISAARSAIDSALVLLEYLEPDFTALEELIAKAEALNENDCDADAYSALMTSVDAAKALIEKEEVRQSEINAMEADLRAKYEAAAPEGGESDTENAPAESESTVLETPPATNVDTGAVPQAPATDAVPEKGGCKSLVLGTSILAVAALLGVTAVTVKKKEGQN